MRNARLWRTLLGVEKTVVEGIDLDDEGYVLVAQIGHVLGVSSTTVYRTLQRSPATTRVRKPPSKGAK